MWIAVLLIVLLIIYAICRFFGALLRPIVDFVYQLVLDLLKEFGLSEMAAKALVSLVIILLILAVIFA